MRRPPSASTATPPPTPSPELPRGGRTIFPDHRLVGFAGGRGESFGQLGVGDIDERANEMEQLGGQYTADGRTPLPVFELIAVVAHGSPTSSGLYRTLEPPEVVDQYLAAARRHQGLLLLNIQPGRADFLDDVRAFALDAVATYLSSLVRTHNLPEKVMVYHQFHTATVADEKALRPHPGVVLVKSVDGVGVPADKVATSNRLTQGLSPHIYTGFKIFFDEDARRAEVMTPAQVLALRPQPSYVLYE
jgi:hypothetical protein